MLPPIPKPIPHIHTPNDNSPIIAVIITAMLTVAFISMAFDATKKYRKEKTGHIKSMFRSISISFGVAGILCGLLLCFSVFTVLFP